VSATRYRLSRRMRLATSCTGRVQLSEENAYSVSTLMPVRAADSTMRLTVRAPARCPAERAKPRRSAQRPLPSMMIATCIARLRAFRRLDQRFQVLEMTGEHPPAFGREAVLGFRDARGEFLLADDV